MTITISNAIQQRRQRVAAPGIRGLLGLVMCISAVIAPTTASATVKASDYVGRHVITDDGQRLGLVADLALADDGGSIRYVVVSVASFLVDNRLIAVAPDALGVAADGEQLVVYSGDLDNAKRFDADNWPAAADVTASSERPAGAVASDSPAPERSTRGFSGGTATISNRWRTAILDGDRREIIDNKPAGGQAGIPVPLPAFSTLDRNSNGRLGRREIGAYLRSDRGYGDIDLDDSGGIDDFEYDVYAESINN